MNVFAQDTTKQRAKFQKKKSLFERVETII